MFSSSRFLPDIFLSFQTLSDLIRYAARICACSVPSDRNMIPCAVFSLMDSGTPSSIPFCWIPVSTMRDVYSGSERSQNAWSRRSPTMIRIFKAFFFINENILSMDSLPFHSNMLLTPVS